MAETSKGGTRRRKGSKRNTAFTKAQAKLRAAAPGLLKVGKPAAGRAWLTAQGLLGSASQSHGFVDAEFIGRGGFGEVYRAHRRSECVQLVWRPTSNQLRRCGLAGRPFALEARRMSESGLCALNSAICPFCIACTACGRPGCPPTPCSCSSNFRRPGTVAVKVILKESMVKAAMKERAINEIELHSRLHHDNIVRVLVSALR